MTPERELHKIKADFHKKVEALAERVRDEMVVPKCEEHGLHFVSGHGMFFFEHRVGLAALDTIDLQDEELVRRYGLGRVLDVLELEVVPDDLLGTYVRDVR